LREGKKHVCPEVQNIMN